MLQLLHEKDDQLRHEECAVDHQRSVLSRVEGTACHYQLLTTFRAWCSHVWKTDMDRAVVQIRDRLASTKIRDACETVGLAVKGVTRHQLVAGMNALSLHAAVRRFREPLKHTCHRAQLHRTLPASPLRPAVAVMPSQARSS